MKLDVKLFARARDVAGTGSVELDVPETANVADLRRALASKIPPLAPLASKLLIAIDTNYADDAMPVSSGADVACFPPVSGG